MSHIPERKEKDCLNCGTIVQGPYCHNCGQQNVVPKETFWHMVTHFFYDITHFDSSFFHSVHHLLFKPGFLSKEYMLGRRAHYLHPVRMYVFTSAIFFLLFFGLFKPEDAVHNAGVKELDAKQRADYIITVEHKLEKDSANKSLQKSLSLLKDTTRPFTPGDVLAIENSEGFRINFADKDYNTFAEYDSVQKTRPRGERDGWLARRFVKMGIDITNKYRDHPDEAAVKLVEGFFHRLPYLLFVSLPLFALILKLVYVRRKQFYFADHGVFTIHLYIFSFIALLLGFGLDKLQRITGGNFMEIVIPVLCLLLTGYLYIAMHNFYRQGWGKTFLKFLLVAILSLVMMMALFLVFLIFSAFTL